MRIPPYNPTTAQISTTLTSVLMAKDGLDERRCGEILYVAPQITQSGGANWSKNIISARNMRMIPNWLNKDT